MPSGGMTSAGMPISDPVASDVLPRFGRLVVRCPRIAATMFTRAHLHRGDDDGDEGEDDAEAVADDERPRRDVRLDEVEVVAEAEPEEADDQRQRRGHAERRADRAGDQVVGHALGDEGLDEVAALGADRAGHAHLRLSLGREHHEDHEDQHDAGGDREQTEDQEEGREEVAGLLGFLHVVLLHRLDVDGVAATPTRALPSWTLEVPAQAAAAASACSLDRAADVALQRDGDVVDFALVPVSRCTVASSMAIRRPSRVVEVAGTPLASSSLTMPTTTASTAAGRRCTR